ncbi:hypothetical protein BVG98_13995 [Lacticaseibacillus rhamnosus]|nr:hypothetical protein LaR308_14400 [Lacticaseibacillus rhamnosus]ONF98556.1 hypothetical protein BVG98_13995 [Lacticaseibacillus rhamnosus]
MLWKLTGLQDFGQLLHIYQVYQVLFLIRFWYYDNVSCYFYHFVDKSVEGLEPGLQTQVS